MLEPPRWWMAIAVPAELRRILSKTGAPFAQDGSATDEISERYEISQWGF